MTEPGPTQWRRSAPRDAIRWLRDAKTQWWIAGGWALDLYLGRDTRAHADVDVGCFRADLAEMRATLDGWAVYAAHERSLERLGPAEAPGEEVHSLWCRPETASEWWLELMLDERDGREWVYRRHADIRLPIRDLLLQTADGIPYLRPEVQLLYKAKSRRSRDEADLRSALPHLDRSALRWLRDALDTWEPGHPWLLELDRAVYRIGDKLPARLKPGRAAVVLPQGYQARSQLGQAGQLQRRPACGSGSST